MKKEYKVILATQDNKYMHVSVYRCWNVYCAYHDAVSLAEEKNKEGLGVWGIKDIVRL